MKYYTAPPGWTHSHPNPFTPDGAYNGCWSAFCILDRDDDQFTTGQSGSGPFSARFGRRVPHLLRRLADFLRYEQRQGRSVILSFPPGYDTDLTVAEALAFTPAENVVRPEDPAVLVHATSAAAWESIRRDGELRAASLLAKPAGDERPERAGPLQEYLLHEPPEYHDYIMFGELDSCVPEMVVASYQAGTFVMDENEIFQPGLRLYFDNHRIIRDGLGTRDGLHTIKTHLRLPLEPYLLVAVGLHEIDPRGAVRAWTIRAFKEQANQYFHHQTESSA